MFKRKKIGLVLGGGGAKGFAHIGVLKALEENNIQIEAISGTSMGAIIGALYCLGYSPKEIERKIYETPWKNLIDIGFSRRGILKGDKLEKYLRKILDNKKFSDLEKPLFINAIDIKNFEEIIFNKGDLAKAIRASISIPGIFEPVENNKRILVDGGLIDNLPIKVLKDNKTKKILAINLEENINIKPIYDSANIKQNKEKIPKLSEILFKSFFLIHSRELKFLLNQKDTFILTPNTKEIKFQDFRKIKQGINLGYSETIKNMKKIKKLMKKDGFFKKVIRKT
ncbi:MAG: patatin-like phospholipase family protein [Nanoarchaeota archaeon]